MSLPICEKLHRHDISQPFFVLAAGLEEKLDNINKLKVKGLVIGPLHRVQAGRPETLDLEVIDPPQGNKEAFLKVIEKASRKGSVSFGSVRLTKIWFYDW